MEGDIKMRLSYLSAVSLLAVIFATLSGSDCADSNLGKRKRVVDASSSTSSGETPPQKKLALDARRGLKVISDSPKDELEPDGVPSSDNTGGGLKRWK